MQLFIINPTVHFQTFMFREPENPRLIIRSIPPGHQLMVYEGSEDDCKIIVSQHEHYGLKKVTEVVNARSYVTLMWSDRPVSFDSLASVHEHNKELLDDLAASERAALTAAVAVKTNEMQQMSQSKPQKVQVEVTQKGTNGTQDKGIQKLEVKDIAS